MPHVLGIDPSLTATGLCRAVVLDHSVPAPGSPYLAKIDVCTLSTFKPRLKTKREYSQRVSHVIDQIEGAFEDVDLVTMEDLAYGAKGEAVWVLPWIFGRVIDLCERHDKELLIVTNSQVKKYATGVGNCKKQVSVLATAKRFPEIAITNDNEADALIVAAIGARHLGLPFDTMPKAHWQDVMTKIGV